MATVALLDDIGPCYHYVVGNRNLLAGIMRLSDSLCFRLALIGILALTPAVAFSLTWRVPSQCPTIHAGLDSASYGDTVLVAPGIYSVTDDSETSVSPGPGEHLMSESGPELTIIEFCDRSVGISLHDCEGARLSGFTVRFGSGPDCWVPPVPTTGVSCYDCTDVIVENCIIEDMGGYSIIVQGHSSAWLKPVFRNNILRNTDGGYGIVCWDMVDPGRPLFQGNTISGFTCGGEFENSSPIIQGNRITNCREWGLYYYGNCGGDCLGNVIIHNGGGVYINADPPYAVPGFNAGLNPPDANDIYDNTGYDLSYECCRLGEQPWPPYAPLNYWGSRCPDSATVFHGPVVFEPWVDSTHTEILNRSDCPDATEPTTWGSIKAMFR